MNAKSCANPTTSTLTAGRENRTGLSENDDDCGKIRRRRSRKTEFARPEETEAEDEKDGDKSPEETASKLEKPRSQLAYHNHRWARHSSVRVLPKSARKEATSPAVDGSRRVGGNLLTRTAMARGDYLEQLMVARGDDNTRRCRWTQLIDGISVVAPATMLAATATTSLPGDRVDRDDWLDAKHANLSHHTCHSSSIYPSDCAQQAAPRRAPMNRNNNNSINDSSASRDPFQVGRRLAARVPYQNLAPAMPLARYKKILHNMCGDPVGEANHQLRSGFHSAHSQRRRRREISNLHIAIAIEIIARALPDNPTIGQICCRRAAAAAHLRYRIMRAEPSRKQKLVLEADSGMIAMGEGGSSPLRRSGEGPRRRRAKVSAGVQFIETHCGRAPFCAQLMNLDGDDLKFRCTLLRILRRLKTAMIESTATTTASKLPASCTNRRLVQVVCGWPNEIVSCSCRRCQSDRHGALCHATCAGMRKVNQIGGACAPLLYCDWRPESQSITSARLKQTAASKNLRRRLLQVNGCYAQRARRPQAAKRTLAPVESIMIDVSCDATVAAAVVYLGRSQPPIANWAGAERKRWPRSLQIGELLLSSRHKSAVARLGDSIGPLVFDVDGHSYAACDGEQLAVENCAKMAVSCRRRRLVLPPQASCFCSYHWRRRVYAKRSDWSKVEQLTYSGHAANYIICQLNSASDDKQTPSRSPAPAEAAPLKPSSSREVSEPPEAAQWFLGRPPKRPSCLVPPRLGRSGNNKFADCQPPESKLRPTLSENPQLVEVGQLGAAKTTSEPPAACRNFGTINQMAPKTNLPTPVAVAADNCWPLSATARPERRPSAKFKIIRPPEMLGAEEGARARGSASCKWPAGRHTTEMVKNGPPLWFFVYLLVFAGKLHDSVRQIQTIAVNKLAQIYRARPQADSSSLSPRTSKRFGGAAQSNFLRPLLYVCLAILLYVQSDCFFSSSPASRLVGCTSLGDQLGPIKTGVVAADCDEPTAKPATSGDDDERGLSELLQPDGLSARQLHIIGANEEAKLRAFGGRRVRKLDDNENGAGESQDDDEQTTEGVTGNNNQTRRRNLRATNKKSNNYKITNKPQPSRGQQQSEGGPGSQTMQESAHRTNISGNNSNTGELEEEEVEGGGGRYLASASGPPSGYRWPFIGLVGFMFLGAAGNILVCMAVWRERRLQTATNYFLLSLAVADLLVCTLVMPFGIIYEFYGHWPFDWRICNLWVTCDVLTCSSSILHMCFISVGRYLGIRNPLHARQTNLFVSRRAVLWRIAIAWASSALIASPITMMSLYDHKNIVPSANECAISNKYFMIFGSLLAFFIPMFVMVPSYVMTVRLLSRRAKFVRNDSLLFTGSNNNTSNHSSGQFNSGAADAGGKRAPLRIDSVETSANSLTVGTCGLAGTGSSSAPPPKLEASAEHAVCSAPDGEKLAPNSRGNPTHSSLAALAHCQEPETGDSAAAEVSGGKANNLRLNGDLLLNYIDADETEASSGVRQCCCCCSISGNGSGSAPRSASKILKNAPESGARQSGSEKPPQCVKCHKRAPMAVTWDDSNQCTCTDGSFPATKSDNLQLNSNLDHNRMSGKSATLTQEIATCGQPSTKRSSPLTEGKLLVEQIPRIRVDAESSNTLISPKRSAYGVEKVAAATNLSGVGRLSSCDRICCDRVCMLCSCNSPDVELSPRREKANGCEHAESKQAANNKSESERVKLRPPSKGHLSSSSASRHEVDLGQGTKKIGELKNEAIIKQQIDCNAADSAKCAPPPSADDGNNDDGLSSLPPIHLHGFAPERETIRGGNGATSAAGRSDDEMDNLGIQLTGCGGDSGNLADEDITQVNQSGPIARSVPGDNCNQHAHKQHNHGHSHLSRSHHHHRHHHGYRHYNHRHRHRHHHHHRNRNHNYNHQHHHHHRHHHREHLPVDEGDCELPKRWDLKHSKEAKGKRCTCKKGEAKGKQEVNVTQSSIAQAGGESAEDEAERFKTTETSSIIGNSILLAALPALPLVMKSPTTRANNISASPNSANKAPSTTGGANAAAAAASTSTTSLPVQHLNFSSTETANEPLMTRYLGSSMQVRSEQKATKVLGVVFFTFVICWTPFFVLNFVQAFLERESLARYISNEMLTTFQWLGYISSTINPVIYTVFNRNFRLAFRQLILCRQPNDQFAHRSRGSEMNKSFRFSQYGGAAVGALAGSGSNGHVGQRRATEGHLGASHRSTGGANHALAEPSSGKNALNPLVRDRVRAVGENAKSPVSTNAASFDEMTTSIVRTGSRTGSQTKMFNSNTNNTNMLMLDDNLSPTRRGAGSNSREGDELLSKRRVDSDDKQASNQVAHALRSALRTTSSLFGSTNNQDSGQQQPAGRQPPPRSAEGGIMRKPPKMGDLELSRNAPTHRSICRLSFAQ